MNEQQIRALVQQEIAKNNQMNRFNLTTTPNHAHTGKGQDGQKINSSDIIPGNTARGLITFATSTKYTLKVNFNPTSLFVYGNAVHQTGSTIDIRAFIIGDAKFAPSSYLQAPKGSSAFNNMSTGGPLYTGNPLPNVASNGTYNNTIIQSSAYFSVSGNASPSGPHAGADQFHLVLVDFSGVLAAADVISFSKNAIVISAVLAAGWSINANYIIT